MIKHLAKANIYQIDNLTSEDVVDVYQLLRVITLENMEELWKEFSGNDEHRCAVLFIKKCISSFFFSSFLLWFEQLALTLTWVSSYV